MCFSGHVEPSMNRAWSEGVGLGPSQHSYRPGLLMNNSFRNANDGNAGQLSHAQLDSAPGSGPAQHALHPPAQQPRPSTPARPSSAADAGTHQRQSQAQGSASSPAPPSPPPFSPGSALGQPRTSQTEIPTNIPKMGGRRLPQAQGVRSKLSDF